MSSCELELTGMDELIEKLTELGNKGTKAMNAALEKGAQPILDNMKATDAFNDRSKMDGLRDNLKVSKVKTRKSGKFIWIGDVDRKAPYSWYLENGTSRMVARPFMRTAYREEKAKALKIIKEEMAKSLKDLN